MRIWRASSLTVCMVAVLATAGTAFAQAKRLVPHLSELGPGDQIRSGRTPLSRTERSALKHITGRAIRACLRDPGLEDPTTVAGYLESLTVHRVLLNDAGLHGLVVQGWGDCMCGATGNCDFWLVEERPSGFEVLLHTMGIQSFAIEKARTNGYFDVVLGTHDSATETDLGLYHYTGTYYRRATCALMSYNGPNWTVLKVPDITPQKCE